MMGIDMGQHCQGTKKQLQAYGDILVMGVGLGIAQALRKDQQLL